MGVNIGEKVSPRHYSDRPYYDRPIVDVVSCQVHRHKFTKNGAIRWRFEGVEMIVTDFQRCQTREENAQVPDLCEGDEDAPCHTKARVLTSFSEMKQLLRRSSSNASKRGKLDTSSGLSGVKRLSLFRQFRSEVFFEAPKCRRTFT